MPIILNMSKDEFEAMRKNVADAEDLEARLGFLEPLQNYEHRETIVDATELNGKYSKLQDDYRNLQQKYIDRFFSGTQPIPEEVEPEEPKPMRYEDLYE